MLVIRWCEECTHHSWTGTHSDLVKLKIIVFGQVHMQGLQLDWECLGTTQNVACGKQKEIGCKGGGGSLQEPISYFSIRLSHTHVKMNKMCLKSISVVIFPKIIFEIEHYECKSIMHANERDACRCVDKTLNYFFLCRGCLTKQYGFPFLSHM